MPTSSIFTTVKITDPKKAEEFINALDEAVNAPQAEKKSNINVHYLTDADKIREMVSKRKKK